MARSKPKKKRRDDEDEVLGTPEEKEADKLLREAKAEFLADYRANKKWRSLADESEDYYDGDQWTDEEKLALEERNQAPIVINRVKPKIDAICGMQMEMSVDTKPFPKGIMDFEKARHMAVALRHVEQTCDFDSQESDAFVDMLKGGRGWYKTLIEWRNFEPRIITTYLDNDDVIPDRDSKKADLSDANQVHETIWMNLSDAKKLFPEYKKELNSCFATKKSFSEVLTGRRRRPDQYQNSENEESADNDEYQDFVDTKRKRIRIVSSQYREAYRQKILVAPGMRMIDVTDYNPKEVEAFLAEFPDAEEFSELRYRLHQVTFCWNSVLEDKRDIAEWDHDATFWYTKVQGYRRKKDNVDYGIIEQMKDPQKDYNKRRSKAIYLLSVNQIIRSKNATLDPENTRMEANKPDGEIVLRDGAQKFEIVRNTELGTAHYQIMQETKRELDDSGVPRELEGMSNASSGREYALKYKSQLAGIRRLFKNLRNSRLQVGRLWMKMIQHYWTHEMALKVSDDPQAPIYLLNQPAVDADGNPVVDPATGEQVRINDLSQGEFDLIVEESPEYINLESETFAQLSALAMKGFPIPPEMLISVAPVPNRQEWMQKTQAQAAAQEQALMAAQLAKQGGQVPVAA